MENKQQTAVRKLIDYITERGFNLEYEMEMSFLDLEEEEIEDAYTAGSYDMARKEFNPTKYYKETYNK